MAKATAHAPRGPNIQFPDHIPSQTVDVWPGRTRSGVTSAMRQQLAEEIAEMEYGSIRQYEVTGEKEQNAFLTRFRSIADEVHDRQFGVQAIMNPDSVIVRLWDRKNRKGSSE